MPTVRVILNIEVWHDPTFSIFQYFSHYHILRSSILIIDDWNTQHKNSDPQRHSEAIFPFFTLLQSMEQQYKNPQKKKNELCNFKTKTSKQTKIRKYVGTQLHLILSILSMLIFSKYTVAELYIEQNCVVFIHYLLILKKLSLLWNIQR